MPTTQVHELEIYFDTFGDPTHDTTLLVSGLGAQCPVYDDELCALLVAGRTPRRAVRQPRRRVVDAPGRRAG